MSAIYRALLLIPSRYGNGGSVYKNLAGIQQNLTRQCSNQATGKPASQAVQAVAEQKKTEVAKHEHLSRKDLEAHHVPTDFHKRILVHFKYYPDMASIPDRVGVSMMGKALSQARVKVSIAMMVIALILCFLTAWYGKTHQHEMSLVEVNLRRHEAYKQGLDASGGRRGLILYDKKKEDVKTE
ncbi:uncharacterized protein LOC111701985 [Eurytemora carolleeae]|uniref:uncharacterized protein LOC111701985 n=1 Tax=Eurytemora carolleeae TaxID=1294199 RepID=UPI000C782047|nr:uncharacterized protein LOC111701985 [Eurytemora carolleeae]|eukprot:XP_023329262.1 uncharacterized protein LOC111701985 [Eurytemora affinis]